MLYFGGFELYSRWVPLNFKQREFTVSYIKRRFRSLLPSLLSKFPFYKLLVSMIMSVSQEDPQRIIDAYFYQVYHK